MKNYDLFVFPEIALGSDDGERVYVDIVENNDITTLSVDYRGQHDEIILESLRDGSSTVVLYNRITDLLYTLYNFKELLQVFCIKPLDFCNVMNQICFIQIDACDGHYFIKAFTPKGEPYLYSYENDFSNLVHHTRDEIHPIDRRFGWHPSVNDIYMKDGKLFVDIYLDKSDFWKRDLFVSHGGETYRLIEGENEIIFRYPNKTEDLYFGERNNHNINRSYKIKWNKIPQK